MNSETSVLTEATRDRIESMVRDNRIMLFMKGTPQTPMCGFSARTISALDSITPEYQTFNVLDDQDIREGIKEYGDWPTIPQLYIDGELVGGCDIVEGMFNNGELHTMLGMEAPDRTPPEINITDEAAKNIKEAMQGHEGIALHFQVDSGWSAQLNLGPAQGNEISTQSNGIEVLMDVATAQRARGAKIDWVDSIHGEGLGVELPQAPPPVRQMSVEELAEALKSGSVTLVDARGAEERESAKIEPSVLLDQDTLAELEAMPKDSKLAFYCHTGVRSQGAAEHFRKKGFTEVSNIAGGIEAWSKEIDPSVPRY
ncbi:MAG TPA: Grx4 family monothiol glutaredoxin [Xanthomonadales bacterium]|nr:Grx4 family monothiol glutaredoxin [Xanthomonadales bacterium]